MKMLSTETLVTRNGVRQISLCMQDFTTVSLPTQGMMKAPSSNRQVIALLELTISKLCFFKKKVAYHALSEHKETA